MAIRTLIKDNFFVGESKILEFTVQGQNVTGWNFQFKLGRDDGWTITKITGAGIAITNANSGIVQVAIDPTDVPIPGPYFWEFRRTDSGFQTMLAFGNAQIQ